MLHSRRLFIPLLAAACLLGFVSAKRRAVEPGPRQEIALLPDRSFAIVDPVVLAPFRMQRVLNALVRGTTVTDEALFRQWWDTQNPKPGLDGSMPHCNDFLLNGVAVHNGYVRRCPTPEGRLATEPYRPESFTPIAIVNRFDLADPLGAHCGQYRLIYAGPAGGVEAFHIIFEGALVNPQPERGIAGCRPVAQFWAGLSGVESAEERRARLETFFFDGIEGFPSAVDADHYHRPPAGIRTLQRTQTLPDGTVPFIPAAFFQFRVIRECAGAGCRVFMRPDVLENLPHGTLFNSMDGSDRAVRFRAAFLQNVASLAVPDRNLYFMNIPAEFLVAESQPTNSEEVFNFIRPYFFGTAVQKDFENAISAELQKIGSTLAPQDIVQRAETQNCAGCHFTGLPIGGGVTFPAALPGFMHVSERSTTGTEATISPAMKDVFIPHRMQILRDFLISGKAPVHSN